MGLLAGQDTLIKEGNKIAYDLLWEKYVHIQSMFKYAELCYGKKEPYIKVPSIRRGIKLVNYISEKSYKYLGNITDESFVIHEWVKFGVNVSSYAKKYGYKPIIKMRTSQKLHSNIVFDNGKKNKEFDTCIVVIEQDPLEDIKLTWTWDF